MRSTKRYAGTLLIIGLALAGCGENGTQPGEPVVYRHALDGAPSSLDPAHAANVYAATVVVNLYDTLYRYKYLARPYQLTPNLAARMPEVSEDGRIWSISLRDDVRFADDPAFPEGRGRRVTASDVVYSLARHFDPATRSQGAWLWRDRIRGIDDWAEAGADPDTEIEGLKAIDETTVRIELDRPYPQLTHTLAMALSAIVPREAVEHYGREFGVHPVGSGPFELARFDETVAVLEARRAFDRGPLDLAAEGHDPARHGHLGLESLDGRHYPFADRIEIHFITEPTARWTSFAAGGEVDNVMVPPEQAGRVLASREPIEFEPEIRSRYHALAKPEAGFVFYGFNMDNPEIGHHDDPERDRRNRALRCAMRDAFDWQTRNEAFYHGLGTVFPGAIPPFLAEYDADAPDDSIRHHPDRARQRLAEHGWNTDNLPTLDYGLESSVHQRQMFEQFRAWMEAIGYPAGKLRRQSHASFGEFNRAIAKRELDMFLLGWTMAYPDPQYSLQMFYGPNAAPGANSFNYRNDEFDRLFERASVLPPGPERTRAYRQLNRMIIDDCVIIGSLARQRLHLWRRHARMLPDREILGGFFLRFVDVGDADG
ncbi:MAG: ABC transporter substrate-binding protein [Wenzhouxiangella sp.]